SRWSLPARYGANREVVALSVARLAEALGNSILTIVIPLYVAEIAHPLFNLPVPVLVGTLISLYGIVSAAVQPVMGALSDRLGRRKVQIQAGMALMGLGTLAFMAATSYSHLLVLRAIQGIGVATTIPASMAVMATATRRHTRASSMGIYSTLRLIGFAGGPVIGGFLKVRFGFDAAFIVGAAFVLLAMILVQVWVRETPPAEPVAPPAPGRLRILDRDLLDPGILAAALATLLMAANFSMVTTLENEFNARLDMTAFEFGIAFAMVMVSRLVFQVPVGRLADTIGRKPLMLGGLLVLAPATGLLGYVTSPAQLMAVRFLQGCGGAGIAAPAFAVAGDLAREGGEGRQMSLVTTGFGLGMTIGPLIAGPLSLFFFQLPFLVGGALALAGLWAVYRYMPETVAGGRGWFRSAAPEKVSDRNAG
ncbi:MAG TPA: MFS transporter, partial [candidate division Zixibacteria bacterium]|nr:MFS transporter [candidate division Zixibacteria bacterium]